MIEDHLPHVGFKLNHVRQRGVNAAGRLEGVYGTNGVEYDLAEAPIPRFDLLDPERYNRLPSGRSAAALGSRSRR